MSKAEQIPPQLKYTQEHEWIRLEGNKGVIGITHYAQEQLGDVVFVELPKVGTKVKRGDPFGVVESVKTVSDLFSPADGVITSVNGELSGAPDLVNKEPYGKGWMLTIEVTSPQQVADLLDANSYEKLIFEQE